MTSLSWSPSGTGPLGVYVHIPFCRQRCYYCSFNTGPYSRAAMDRFLSALGMEIELAGEAGWASRVTVGTIFFGGGTPSLLEPDELALILGRLRKRFALASDVEVTVECNPESVSREKLEGYRLAGVNRISLGVQSLDDALLGRLGRLHSAREARLAFDAARAASIRNINVDLMYGLPGLDLPRWEATLSAVLAWGPEHLSAYGLTLDEGSRWASEGVSGIPAEEVVVSQYWLLARLARDAGYEHYEISNYCRPGRRARHNQLYWRAGEYLGLGPGACGFLGDVRYGDVKPPERYCTLLERGESPVAQWERITDRQRFGERLILGLRLAEGVPLTWLEERAAREPHRLPRLIQTWQALGLLVLEGQEAEGRAGDNAGAGDGAGRARLTEAGFLLSDALFVEIL
jgi:oxygen-independent coproporphyrinogen-3 oxidase